jgi:hypothetical protein
VAAEDGFLTAALGEDYPLMPGAPAALAPVLADLVFTYDHLQTFAADITGPVTVVQVACNSGSLHFIISINGTHVLDTNAVNIVTSRVSSWDTWKLFEWVDASNTTLRVIVDAAALTALGSYDSGTINAPICARAVRLRQDRVKTVGCPLAYSINSVTGLPFDQTVSAVSVSGDVVLEAGYNTEIDLADDGSLQVNYAPGAGKGRYPLCTQTATAVCSINGVTVSDDGNLRIAATDCYWLERRVGGPDPGHTQSGPFSLDGTRDMGTYGFYDVSPAGKLQLHNDCPPCSDCSTYAALYKLLRTVYLRLKAVQGRALSAIGQYDSLRGAVSAFGGQSGAASANFTLNGTTARLTLGIAFTSGGTSKFDQVAWTVLGPTCPTTYFGGSGLQIVGSGTTHFNPGSAENHYNFTDNENFNAGVSAAWTFDVAVLCPSTSDGAELTFTGTITAREVLADGTIKNHSFGPFARTVIYHA